MLSVIIPVFNRARQLLLAVDFVFKQHGLNATQMELIVVDDNSTPPVSRGELGGWEGGRVKLLKLAKNCGPAAARNAGILAATGELIAFLDSDDVWLPAKLARQVALLNQVTAAQPETLHAVSCGFYYKGGLAKRLHGRMPNSAAALADFAGGCWFSPGSTLLLRRESFSRVGLFDERLRALEDFDWFVRFGRLGGHLHVEPHLDVIVYRQDEPQTMENLQNACDLITRKFQSRDFNLTRTEENSLKAYIDLELAVQNFYAGNPWLALTRALKSFATHFRLRARLQKYWHRSDNVPQEIKHSYRLLERAAQTEHATCDILTVVHSLLVGGTEKHLSLILPALRERGYVPKLFNISGVNDAQISDVLIRGGVDIISPTRRVTPQLLGIFGLMRKLYSEKPKIVHFFLPRAYIIGAPLALFARRSALVMSWRSLNNYQHKHKVLSFIERLLHSKMTAVVGNSQKVVEQLSSEYRSPGSRPTLIYNGVSLAPFDQPFDKKHKRSQLGLAEGRLVFITVANLIGYKGHEELITAVASIRAQLLQDWVLLIAGRDDGIETIIKEKVINLGLGENVIFLGQRSDVVELLRIADIALLCSHEEGFSNALLEMMAAALPCVATNVGGNPEAVVDGVTGLLVPSKDPGAIAQAILRLANNPRMRRQMGEAGRKRVRQHFSLNACVDEYEALYCSILGNDASRVSL